MLLAGVRARGQELRLIGGTAYGGSASSIKGFCAAVQLVHKILTQG